MSNTSHRTVAQFGSERGVRDAEAAGSNPVCPTIRYISKEDLEVLLKRAKKRYAKALRDLANR